MYQINIPPESLPWLTLLSLVDGKMISLYPKGQPVGMSPLFQVSCKTMISEFFNSFLKSGVLLLRPKAEDLRPWMFQHEITKDLDVIGFRTQHVAFCVKISTSPSVSLSLYTHLHLSLSLSTHLHLSLSTHLHLSLTLYTSPSLSHSLHITFSLTLYTSPSLSHSLHISFSLTLYTSPSLSQFNQFNFFNSNLVYWHEYYENCVAKASRIN